MLHEINPLFLIDGYKLSHRVQEAPGTTETYVNWTPRKSRIPDIDKVVCFGLQYLIKEYLIDRFNKYFFGNEDERTNSIIIDKNGKWQNSFREKKCQEYKQHVEEYLGGEYEIDHIKELWDLGYLPIEIKALPEGTRVPIGTPMFTIRNTDSDKRPQFAWLPTYLETLISDTIWPAMTSATIAYEYRKIFEEWAEKTGCKTDIVEGILNNIDIQGHDFSMRGMSGTESAIISGMGHLTSFKGTDTLPAILALNRYYNGQDKFKGCSVPASEHSVMSANVLSLEQELNECKRPELIQEFYDKLPEDKTIYSNRTIAEYGTIKRFITEIYPSGIVSIVCDTFNLWEVATIILPRLKNEILARNGKVVIRPDSGNPVDILCGYHVNIAAEKMSFGTVADTYEKHKEIYGDATDCKSKAEFKGLIELLWDIFGGTITDNGFAILNEHIGAIYGDAITPERAKQICCRLYQKGFASCNWVAGIGSYTYQYNTRDTFGFALKSTYIKINRKGIEIYKDPITDSGMKKSLKGLLRVNEDLSVTDQCSEEEEKQGLLRPIFRNGVLLIDEDIDTIRERLKI